jgi:TatA/E family protein of Tat protein translocase
VFGISGTELVLIAIFALIIFGPDKVPQMARTVSKAIQTFKRAQDDMERMIKTEMYSADPDKENSPFAPNDPFAAPGITPPDAGGQPATVASTLYSSTDEDEEEEDEE